MRLIARSIVVGILIALLPANVWLLLLATLRVPLASAVEAAFLGVLIWWASGGGPPHRFDTARRTAFRTVPHGARVWVWSLVAAVAFAATVHAAMVVLFRLVPFPADEFHRGYDISFIPTRSLQWLAVVVSAASAGVCEEIGFRGYMQRPIELQRGTGQAIVISSLAFMLIHLTKGWALVGMVPIVFGAGLMLGALARASRSLIPGMIGHTIMDIGLFGFWWTGLAGAFTARPIGETGLDRSFVLAAGAAMAFLVTVLFALTRLVADRQRAPEAGRVLL